MALWRCLTCATRYAVGLDACPHCRAPHVEEKSGPEAAAAPEEAAEVPVAAQLASGVAAEDTVTLADQRAGVPLHPDAEPEPGGPDE